MAYKWGVINHLLTGMILCPKNQLGPLNGRVWMNLYSRGSLFGDQFWILGISIFCITYLNPTGGWPEPFFGFIFPRTKLSWVAGLYTLYMTGHDTSSCFLSHGKYIHDISMMVGHSVLFCTYTLDIINNILKFMRYIFSIFCCWILSFSWEIDIYQTELSSLKVKWKVPSQTTPKTRNEHVPPGKLMAIHWTKWLAINWMMNKIFTLEMGWESPFPSHFIHKTAWLWSSRPRKTTKNRKVFLGLEFWGMKSYPVSMLFFLLQAWEIMFFFF